jgi:hypothetical protein
MGGARTCRYHPRLGHGSHWSRTEERAVRPYTAASALSLALLATGCGATKVVTVLKTQTVTRTIVRHTPAPAAKPRTHSSNSSGSSRNSGDSSRGGYASSYPVSFRSAFDTRCVRGGNSSSYCGCVVHYLEQHTPFSSVSAQARNSFATTDPPSWFVRAENHCFTP